MYRCICVCMCVCVCMYTYVCMYACIKRMHVCVCVCMYTSALAAMWVLASDDDRLRLVSTPTYAPPDISCLCTLSAPTHATSTHTHTHTHTPVCERGRAQGQEAARETRERAVLNPYSKHLLRPEVHFSVRIYHICADTIIRRHAAISVWGISY